MNKKSYYADATVHLGYINGKWESRQERISQLLLNPEHKREIKIDHIDGDTLNNRRENLRVTIPYQNSRNRAGKNRNNKSGYRNVAYFKNVKKKPYCVQLMINGKNTKLGCFDDVDEAGKFAEEMRQKYYGEYAGNN